MDYKEAYEKEHIKTADLAERVAVLEAKNEELTFKLGRIKNNPLWKASAPLRKGMHFVIRQRDRLKNCGNLKGVVAKIKYKQIEHKAMEQFGTKSFPDEERARKEREQVFERMVKISILVPLWNTPENFLREMIESVTAQTYQNWELCLADGSDGDHTYVETIVREYQEKDGRGRILYKKLEKNEGIAGNTNRCLAMATGEYIGLFDHDDILHPSALYEYVKVINEKNADYIYCDETTFKSGDINKMLTMHFKPDYAIDNLRANNYICHFSVFARQLLDGTELFRTKFDGSQDHDMILRLTDRAKNVVHVPKLLYYWRSHPGSVASDINAKPYAIQSAKDAVADHLKRHGYEHFQITSTRAFETIFKIRYQIIGDPKISIVIANKDHLEDLKRCITSIREKSTYENYEIIVVENGSETKEIFDYYEKLKDDPQIKVVTYTEKGSFNYSKVNNFGVKETSGDYILLLNNDTQVITVNWMEELLMYAQREDVGAVGAKLYYGNKTIQHAGVVLQLGAHRTAGHSHYGQHRDNLGYMGRLCYAQDVSAVTGACLLVKKKLFEEVGGLDESFAISLNDVDFCLKLREKGLLNVFTPFAELYHFESVSRGLDDQGEKAARYNDESERFREKWKEVLEKGDPYYNPNFSLDRSDFALKI
ncbi:MAG: glycosyltransferase family 2 protein [Lachnospiraceae bacterium]|nr:glycosyltransferase family 2 protein [Lachnospiraceae bacterium]MDD7628422.1 glycosyltransferase family 2 protein [Lachnospiraceae bacterium]MDY4119948.1 glycosyltransferase family 2 protein [Lachnospiraceae bacterium]